MIAELVREAFGGFGRALSGVTNPDRWLIDWVRGGTVTSGVSVDESSALTYSAVWAATSFIAGAVASLPCILYRELDDDDRERAKDHSLYRLLKDAPNKEQDSFIFWEMQAALLVNWGNCYAEIERTVGGQILAVWPIHPRRVKPMRNDAGELVYEVTEERGAKHPVAAADMLHIAGRLSEDGITGKGVIRQARESIGMGIATERFGASFFGNGAVPGGVLMHPGELSVKAEEHIRTGWERMHGGPDRANRIAVLREGMKYEKVGIPPEDAQFLETRQHNVTEIARWYGLPPHVLADLTRATFSNIEQQDLDLVKHSLRPWLVRIERALKRQLLGQEDEDLYWEFLVDALLRGDSVARADSFARQFLNGALTLNEWRRAENRNRIKGEAGDAHFVPLNLVPLERAMEPPEPPPAQPPLVPPSDDDEGEDRDDPAAKALPEVRDLLRSILDRMVRIEANELRRAAKSPGAFLSRLDAFCAAHRQTLVDATGPAVAALLALSGPDGDPEKATQAAAVRHVERFRQAALAAADSLPAELAAAVERAIDSLKHTTVEQFLENLP